MRAVCGLDVHKDSVFLCILHDSGEIFEKVYGVLKALDNSRDFSSLVLIISFVIILIVVYRPMILAINAVSCFSNSCK